MEIYEQANDYEIDAKHNEALMMPQYYEGIANVLSWVLYGNDDESPFEYEEEVMAEVEERDDWGNRCADIKDDADEMYKEYVAEMLRQLLPACQYKVVVRELEKPV